MGELKEEDFLKRTPKKVFLLTGARRAAARLLN